jgi:hypothetical protein
MVTTSVAYQHHFDSDLNPACHLDADPDADADPDPDSDPSF